LKIGSENYPFSLDGKKLYYLVRRTPGREYASDHAVGELWELDLQSGATQAILPRLTIFDFSLSPDGRDVVYAVLRDDDTRNIWVAPLDRSSPARMLQTDADHPGFTPSYIYYTKRALDGAHVHRIHPDGSGDEQIWDEKIQSLATSPDGRYLALTVPIEKSAAGVKHGQQWRLEVVDWARKRVYPVCDDAVAYWSGDGKSFLVSPIGIYKGAPTYVFSPPADGGIPELPSNGISNITEFAKLKHVRTIPQTSIGIGRTPDSYAFVKETVQRNLYRIPLR